MRCCNRTLSQWGKHPIDMKVDSFDVPVRIHAFIVRPRAVEEEEMVCACRPAFSARAHRLSQETEWKPEHLQAYRESMAEVEAMESKAQRKHRLDREARHARERAKKSKK